MVIAPARIAGDPGSNPGPGENFSLKLLISTCQMVILKNQIYIYISSHDLKFAGRVFMTWVQSLRSKAR